MRTSTSRSWELFLESYKIDFYGPDTSSTLHRNGTDRLWVKWPLTSRRVQTRLQGK